MAAGVEVDYAPWGWDAFFREVEVFLLEANREIRNTSLQYADFAIERLQVIVLALSTICLQFQGETNREVLEVYTYLVQLRGCCRDILALWKDHQDHLESLFSEILQPQVESYKGQDQNAVVHNC